jgi:hypothetical protein
VRRLLAEARHDEPVPADVAARLDDALADLSRDSRAPADEPVAAVIDLAARRRRRNASALLAGAAAVIVAGFAIGQGIDVSGDGDNAATTGDSSVARDDAGGAAESQTDGLANPAPTSGPTKPEVAKGKPVHLTSGHLRRDIVMQMSVLDADQSLTSGHLAESYGSASVDCPTLSGSASTPGIGTLFPAYYDGNPAVLVLGPVSNGTREAQVLSCTTGEPVRSVTVKAQ